MQKYVHHVDLVKNVLTNTEYYYLLAKFDVDTAENELRKVPDYM